MEPLQTWWTTELYPTSDEDNFGVVGNFEVVKAADAQATIAALQARVTGLEQWVQDQSTANLEKMRHMDEMQSRAMEAESQLTQRTAELEAANKLLYKKNCALGRAETSINDLQAELERVILLSSHNERRFEAVDKKYKELRTLILTLPKVEGEIRLIHADDGDWHVVDLYDAIFTDKSWAVSYAALLQHRQGMEG